MQRGAALRATAATALNDMSSRSHAVFVIALEQAEVGCDGTKRFCSAKLNLVVLAGSERARATGASGARLEECKKINGSLAALGNVIAALTDTRRGHVPYRDSKLTRLLEDSLGGNCKTTLIACLSAAALDESLSTLKFAARARHVRNGQ